MKTKLILSLLAASLSACATAQEVSYAPVISVTPIERQFTSYELTEPICTTVQVPVERRIPVYREVVRDSSAPLLGMIVGAAIGHHLARGGDNRAIGTVLGAGVGYTMVDNQRYSQIVEYRTEIHYENRQSCNRRSELVTRNIVDGYRVVYEFQGLQRVITMKSHPGAHVRIVTSHQVTP
jgi:uncharacterized protein YcfJ